MLEIRGRAETRRCFDPRVRVEAGTERGRGTTADLNGQTRTARGGFATLLCPELTAAQVDFQASTPSGRLHPRSHRDFHHRFGALLDTLLYGLTSPANVNLVIEGFNVASLLIDPAIVFLVMFLIGKDMDPAGDFSRTIGSLLVGTVVGTYLCLTGVALYAYWVGLFDAFEHQLGLDILYDAFGAFRLSLVAFAGLTISYLSVRRPRTPPIEA